MTARIRPATVSDIPTVAAFLATSLKGSGGAERYRRYLDYAWPRDRDDVGVLLEVEGRVRGFIGAIYSHRFHNGSDARFCNLTSIAVDPTLRKHTLRMFAALLGCKRPTYTCFSASTEVAKILEFFKFRRLETRRSIVTPVSVVLMGSRLGAARVFTRPDELERRLGLEELRISRDHQPYRCAQLLIESGAERCFVIAARRGHGIRSFADVIYASRPPLLVQHVAACFVPLARALRTGLVAVDTQWLGTDSVRGAFSYDQLRPTHVRAADRFGGAIDALYSELVLARGRR
jgi:hypothetical protein